MMACAAPQKAPPKKQQKSHLAERKTAKLFVTSYTDDFYSERDLLRKEIFPQLHTWCDSQNIHLTECFVKWGGMHPESRDVIELERIQTVIENCYYNKQMPLFINISSESLGWVPMWGEYPDEVVEEYMETFGLLVEDLQLMYGAYREDNANYEIPEAERDCFLEKKPVMDRLFEHKNKVAEKFSDDRICKYECSYKGLESKRNHPVLQFEDTLKQQIVDFVKHRLSKEYCCNVTGLPPDEKDPYSFVRKAHEIFMYRKSESVIGRQDLVKIIEDYVIQGEKDVPLILLGDAGSGKSSVMCLAADNLTKKASNRDLARGGARGWHVFCHFVGAIPGSSTLDPLLKRLLTEMEVANDSKLTMPKNLDATSQLCCSMLANPNTKPLILFIDAVNQFTDDAIVKVLSWLPRKLAPQIRIILSMITDSAPHKTLQCRETKCMQVQLMPLDVESRQGIVRQLLGQHNKCLSDIQLEKLLSKQSSGIPLWLCAACEELCLVDDSQHIDDKIDELADGLLNLLEQLLTRLEEETYGNLVVATLCLLEASNAGLLESELRYILGDEESLMPPPPFDEKEEKETSEKEVCKTCHPLPEKKWNVVFSVLQSYLRPFGNSREGRLDFYHTGLSKAVRRKYFMSDECEDIEQTSDTDMWWHKKLADYFETVSNIDRKVEEYPYQLVCLRDKFRLANCLTDWEIFDKLYNEEYSFQLLAYWRKVDSANEMVSRYMNALERLEEEGKTEEEELSIRHEKVARVEVQAGKHHEAMELLKTALKIEEIELGARPHRMVELFALMSELYDEKLKLTGFMSPSQHPDLKKTIAYGRKSIAGRKQLPGNYHRLKLGISLMKLAFNMERWRVSGGGCEISDQEAIAEGNSNIDMALKIFRELNDMGHYAEAVMTKGVMAPRASMEQLKYYNEAMDLCMQIFGEYHILTSRLYINIGILYEDKRDFKKAYGYFKQWGKISEEIHGSSHPKSQRAKGVLREPRYKRIAMDLGEWDYEKQPEDADDEMNSDDDDVENRDFENYYDDSVGRDEANNHALQGDNMNAANNRANDTDNEDNDNTDTEQVLNSCFDEDNTHSDEHHHEISDNENFYDDHFEDYDEQYILHADTGPIIEEFNVHLGSDDDGDYDLVALSEITYPARDNRYASDSHEEDDEPSLYSQMYNCCSLGNL